MRRNHNRKLSPELKLSKSINAPEKRDKGADSELNKGQIGFGSKVKQALASVGKWLKKFFWGGSQDQPTFQKPEWIGRLVPSRLVKKRKAKRKMQRISRRKNRGANRG